MVGPLEAAAGPQENDPASANASNRIDDSVDALSPADAEHPPDDPHPADNGHAAGDDHDGQHGHHDPHDLSHANATAKLEDPTEWRYDLALCTFAVFIVLLALLRVVAWRPLMTGLERREGAIAARIDEAERDAAEAAAQLQAYREKLAGAAQEAQEVIARARREAEAVAERVRGAAAEDAQRERERALADIRTAKEAALREVAEQGADLALGLAGRIVRRELKPQDHAELVREALGRFPSEN
jgi:F-type H+-transporting ATPase subunit b